ncbi:uncharacterized protein LOC143427733 [Xylocopa sonorina]|uniref:uncharacterized protein LOC143427733 n=1 Tax=Xylocopa sonorina TaxID=1818115 RepID=UPI00403B27DA
MNWEHGSRQVEKDGEEEDDDEDGDEHDRDDDNQRLIDRGSTSHEFLFSFERETRCSKRFPRRRGRLDKAEEAE